MPKKLDKLSCTPAQIIEAYSKVQSRNPSPNDPFVWIHEVESESKCNEKAFISTLKKLRDDNKVELMVGRSQPDHKTYTLFLSPWFVDRIYTTMRFYKNEDNF